MKDEKKGFGYIGKIKNQSSQVVEAPLLTTPKKQGKVKQGTDLRSGKK